MKYYHQHHCNIRNHITITPPHHRKKQRGGTTEYEVDQQTPEITQVSFPILVRMSIIGVLVENQVD